MSRTTIDRTAGALLMAALLVAGGAEAREMTSAYVVTAAANTAGREGTDWHTDLTLHNPHSFDLPVEVVFLPSGRDNSAGGYFVDPAITLYPYETLNLWDVLGPAGFDMRGRTGALLIYTTDDFYDANCTSQGDTDCDFSVFSRTYTLDPRGGAGEFGQAVPGFPSHLSLDGTVLAYLPQISADADFRTNLGAASLTDGTVWVRVEIQNPDGDIIARNDYPILPWGHAQWSLNTRVTGGTAVVSLLDGPADSFVFPYASVVNQATGDAVNVEADMTPVGLSAQSASPARALRARPRPPRGEGVSVDRERLSRTDR